MDCYVPTNSIFLSDKLCNFAPCSVNYATFVITVVMLLNCCLNSINKENKSEFLRFIVDP